MRRKIYDYFLLTLLAFAFYGVIRLLAPFSGALLGALICSVMFYPMYVRLQTMFPKRQRSIVAAVADLLVMVFFVVPVIILTWAIYRESAGLMEFLRQGSAVLAQWREGNMSSHIPCIGLLRTFCSNVFGIDQTAFQAGTIIYVNRIVGHFSEMGPAIARNVVLALINVVIMLFTLFFMFRDGEKFSNYIQNLIPMRRENRYRLMARIRETVVGVIRGSLLTAFVQGLTAALGYMIVGIDGAVLLGAITAAAALIPVVGTFVIALPAAAYLFAHGSSLKGGFVLFWEVVMVIGVIDALVRPYLVGRRTQLSMFVLFFALLGGVEAWGSKGIILGPVLAAIVPDLLQMYRERYLRTGDGTDFESRVEGDPSEEKDHVQPDY